MELIPILSTIILVATICTFILAIGAYILYKVRESKGQSVATPAPATVKAELVSPVQMQEQEQVVVQPAYAEAAPAYQTQRQPMYQGQPAPRMRQAGPEYRPASYPTAERQRDSKFMKYTTEGYVPAKEDKNAGALRWR